MEKQPTMGKWLLTGAILLVLLQAADWAKGKIASPALSAEAAAMQIATIDGDGLQELIAAEQTPSLVFIYASWCPHCRRQAPIMEQLALDYEGKLRVVPISVDKEPDKLKAYLASKGLLSPQTLRVAQEDYLDFRRALAATGSQFTGAIPHSVLISPDGNMMDEAAGFIDYDSFKSGLDQLL